MLEEFKPKNAIKCKLKKGDEVKVITGSHRGKTGTIEKVDRKSDRVFVTGINLVKRHTKPSSANQDGGIVEKLAGIHVSNVAFLDPKSKKPSRLGYKVEGNTKVRISKKSKSVV